MSIISVTRRRTGSRHRISAVVAGVLALSGLVVLGSPALAQTSDPVPLQVTPSQGSYTVGVDNVVLRASGCGADGTVVWFIAKSQSSSQQISGWSTCGAGSVSVSWALPSSTYAQQTGTYGAAAYIANGLPSNVFDPSASFNIVAGTQPTTEPPATTQPPATTTSTTVAPTEPGEPTTTAVPATTAAPTTAAPTTAAPQTAPSTTPSGPTVTVNSNGTIRRGDVTEFLGWGFPPFGAVAGMMYSTPVSLGSQTADANGAVRFSVRIPADFELGQHRVVLSSGSVSAEFGFTVAASTPSTPAAPAATAMRLPQTR